MTKAVTSADMPEDVARLLKEAAAQRKAYEGNPDPLIVAEPEPEIETLDLTPDEILAECALEPETDIGNCRRLIIRFGDRIRFITHVGWHGYDGRRWLEDPSGAVVRVMAHKTAEFIDDEAIKLDCSEEEQSAIASGRDALERRKELGKRRAELSDDDIARAAELDGVIDDAKAARREKDKIGKPLKSWSKDEHDLYDALHARIDAGKVAEKERRKIGDIDAAWTIEETIEADRLEQQIEAMAAVQEARGGRISSRHNHAKSSAGTSKINNMLGEAIPYVSLMVNDLNKDLYSINCHSGTLRFFCSEVGGIGQWQVRRDRHRPSDLISKLAEVDFDPAAAAPQFERFLKRVQPNPDNRAFLQRFMGYCLLGSTLEQCLLFFYGAGRNGKSTFVDLMVEILSDYAVSMSIDSFAGDSKRAGAEATPDLARLPGARLVAAAEPEMGVRLKDALIKTLTGGEAIAVRRLHQDFFELIPQFKIILSGNHKPIIHDDSDGIWRRVHLVPWDIQIPEADVDRDLPRKLRTEKAGIFAWMVKGALDYLQRGLQVPAGVTAATAEYREESDPIGAFIRNACHVTGSDGDKENPGDLFNAYMRYAKREGLSEFKQATFTKRFPDQARKTWTGPEGTMHQFRKAKSSVSVYLGIRIRDEFRGTGDEPPQGRFGSDEPFYG